MVKKKVSKEKSIKQDFCGVCGRKCGPGMRCGSGGCFYVLGFIGALVYYISIATGFWMGVLGILKALVWPAFLVFELMKFLGL